jgi:hypothetical protein
MQHLGVSGAVRRIYIYIYIYIYVCVCVCVCVVRQLRVNKNITLARLCTSSLMMVEDRNM